MTEGRGLTPDDEFVGTMNEVREQYRPALDALANEWDEPGRVHPPMTEPCGDLSCPYPHPGDACRHERWVADSDGSGAWACLDCEFTGHDESLIASVVPWIKEGDPRWCGACIRCVPAKSAPARLPSRDLAPPAPTVSEDRDV